MINDAIYKIHINLPFILSINLASVCKCKIVQYQLMCILRNIHPPRFSGTFPTGSHIHGIAPYVVGKHFNTDYPTNQFS